MGALFRSSRPGLKKSRRRIAQLQLCNLYLKSVITNQCIYTIDSRQLQTAVLQIFSVIWAALGGGDEHTSSQGDNHVSSGGSAARHRDQSHELRQNEKRDAQVANEQANQ